MKGDSSAHRYCPPPGPILPPPSNIESSHVFISDALLKNTSWFDSSTFAIKASIGDVPVINYQHWGKINSAGSATKDLFNTKFRLASVTKVFTVLAVLLSGDKIGWEDSITKYIPGLEAALYKDVSISALAGQTSGLGRYGYVSDLSFLPTFSPKILGLTPINTTLPGCDPFPGGTVCTASQVLDMFNDPNHHPHSPNSVSLYSNIAYNLLGQALESVYPNQSYASIIKKLIFEPIGMQTAGFDTPSASDEAEAILPLSGQQWFAAPFSNFDPAGGIWATPDEFHKFAMAVRGNKLLNAAETRKWLQPRSFLPSYYQLVGAPWEIIRPSDLKITVPRPIDIYTKSGGVPGYTSYLVLIPEYDVTITINVAGDKATPALQTLLPTVIKPLVAYADTQARQQALAKYAGTYRGASGSNSSLVLTIDGGPGLKISSFNMNGAPVVAGLAAMRGIPVASASARVYPYDTDAWAEGKQVWRFQLDGPMATGNTWADLDCASWNFGDPARYVGNPLDILNVKVDSNGKAKEIELVGWRSTLKRTKD
ncbi:beta-lactamase/transpeptidase-like protein [Massarina eburnea CBS 473.64]|uniref:Beta-lactamase/transpeptidase-like protein n=1 Tax=Massarina eburnea CBS 473.64 TaxID=1395130 RepID=A0A6A6RRC8_9PLEO|nr:beta-lactamase/transpeptidase-like protein [Massarina eburnea CBS 473.64]